MEATEGLRPLLGCPSQVIPFDRSGVANVIYHWPDDGIVVLEKIFHHEPPFSPSIINELHETLRSVGYEDDEIRSAIKAIGTKFDSKNKSENQDLTRPIDDIECLLKASLLWLSNDSK